MIKRSHVGSAQLRLAIQEPVSNTVEKIIIYPPIFYIFILESAYFNNNIKTKKGQGKKELSIELVIKAKKGIQAFPPEADQPLAEACCFGDLQPKG